MMPMSDKSLINMTLQQAADVVKGTLLFSELTADLNIEQQANQTFTAIATDTRQDMLDSLFVALKGENFNGHEYLAKAKQQGAVSCLIDQHIDATELVLPAIKVADTVNAMGLLAQFVRVKSAVPCIAITGSCGKTTVKEMIASILSEKGKVLATNGNFNNAIGVPLTLFRLTESDQFAVIEMGASQPGDIDQIAEWAKPNVVVITNVSEAHLLGLGNVEGVSKVKGEILNHLQEKGTAVLEHESPWLEQWKKQLVAQNQSSTTSFSLNTFSANNTAASFYATNITANERCQALFTVHTPDGSVEIKLPISGEHNINNALAAIAASVAVGATLEECSKGLAELKAVNGRLQFQQGIQGSQLINDSYNANPASLKVALELLSQLPGKQLLILGDMAELGEQAESAHEDAGVLAKKLNIDGLYATGKLSKLAVNSFGQGAEHFESKELLSKEIIQKITKDGIKADPIHWNLLIKGSRSAGMEQVVKDLLLDTQQKKQNKKQQQKIGDPTCF